MKGKVLLINPPIPNIMSGVLLNLAYLSSQLKLNGHEVKIIDGTAPFKPLTKEDILKIIKDYKPDFIGITVTISYILETYKFIDYISTLQIPIVVGGSHANCLPKEVLNHKGNIVVVGEGEETILELIQYFLGNKDLESIKGICYKQGGKIVYNEARPLIKDIDLIPFPDYDSFPIKNYTGSDDADSDPIFWSVFSSRGCPYNCIFCSSHNVFGRNYRKRSPDNVVHELKYLNKRYGAKIFAFQDDEGFIDHDRIMRFCNLLITQDLDFKFSARMRIDTLDESMLTKMKEVGFKRLAFGVESLNDETLKKINKMYLVKDVHSGFNILKKVKFMALHFNFLVGFPWETPEHLKKNLQELYKLDKSNLLFIACVNPIPFPATKLYNDNYKKYGFKEWWLDPESDILSTKNTFFMLFLFSYKPLFTKNRFWGYSKKMKQAIDKFCFDVAYYCMKQHSPKLLYITIFWASKISFFLWKKSPFLEKILFFPLTKLAILLKLNNKLKFINYY